MIYLLKQEDWLDGNHGINNWDWEHFDFPAINYMQTNDRLSAFKERQSHQN